MSFRGLFKNRCEWLLICTAHNLLKLWRAARRSKAALAPLPDPRPRGRGPGR
jgi:hypothetical protein